MIDKEKEPREGEAILKNIKVHYNFSKQFLAERGGVAKITLNVIGTYEDRVKLLDKAIEAMNEWVQEMQTK